jgi:hypothetical protein
MWRRCFNCLTLSGKVSFREGVRSPESLGPALGVVAHRGAADPAEESPHSLTSH